MFVKCPIVARIRAIFDDCVPSRFRPEVNAGDSSLNRLILTVRRRLERIRAFRLIVKAFPNFFIRVFVKIKVFKLFFIT